MKVFLEFLLTFFHAMIELLYRKEVRHGKSVLHKSRKQYKKLQKKSESYAQITRRKNRSFRGNRAKIRGGEYKEN